MFFVFVFVFLWWGGVRLKNAVSPLSRPRYVALCRTCSRCALPQDFALRATKTLHLYRRCVKLTLRMTSCSSKKETRGFETSAGVRQCASNLHSEGIKHDVWLIPQSFSEFGAKSNKGLLTSQLRGTRRGLKAREKCRSLLTMLCNGSAFEGERYITPLLLLLIPARRLTERHRSSGKGPRTKTSQNPSPGSLERLAPPPPCPTRGQFPMHTDGGERRRGLAPRGVEGCSRQSMTGHFQPSLKRTDRRG